MQPIPHNIHDFASVEPLVSSGCESAGAVQTKARHEVIETEELEVILDDQREAFWLAYQRACEKAERKRRSRKRLQLVSTRLGVLAFSLLSPGR